MRLALGVEYNGTNFHGWQYQPHIRTVQCCVEEALSKIANHPVRVFCAGRTDSGVHAYGQVIHFNTKQYRPEHSWLLGGNHYLPNDISFRWVKVVDDNFHARFSAIARRYQYRIYNHPIRPAINYSRQTWIARKLDTSAMQLGANHLIGKHNFSAFRSSQCRAKTPIKTIESLCIRREEAHIFIDIKANAFLHHMVRNIVGTLVKVGFGDKPPRWLITVLKTQDRKAAGMNMPVQGLYFIKVYYEVL